MKLREVFICNLEIGKTTVWREGHFKPKQAVTQTRTFYFLFWKNDLILKWAFFSLPISTHTKLQSKYFPILIEHEKGQTHFWPKLNVTKVVESFKTKKMSRGLLRSAAKKWRVTLLSEGPLNIGTYCPIRLILLVF